MCPHFIDTLHIAFVIVLVFTLFCNFSAWQHSHVVSLLLSKKVGGFIFYFVLFTCDYMLSLLEQGSQFFTRISILHIHVALTHYS